jgi:hypothetical protein
LKRIQAACLEQTIHFLMKEDVPKADAAQMAEAEYAHYLAQLDRSGTVYRVLEKKAEPDGSILVRLKRQYNSYRTGDYLA